MSIHNSCSNCQRTEEERWGNKLDCRGGLFWDFISQIQPLSHGTSDGNISPHITITAISVSLGLTSVNIKVTAF